MTFHLKQIKKPDGLILYKNDRVVIIATGFNVTDNPKTGNAIQVWILPRQQNPITIYNQGHDHIVCGDCKHRSIKSGGLGTCYVSVHQAPRAIWKKWNEGGYEPLNSLNVNYFNGRVVRLGAYGDPAFMPIELIKMIAQYSKSVLGYTHQWRKAKHQNLKNYCMASVDTENEYNHAKNKGWRTFRIRQESDVVLSNEFICPGSDESKVSVQCEKCKACSGNNRKNMFNPVIVAHGRKWKINRIKKAVKFLKQKKSYLKVFAGR